MFIEVRSAEGGDDAKLLVVELVGVYARLAAPEIVKLRNTLLRGAEQP